MCRRAADGRAWIRLAPAPGWHPAQQVAATGGTPFRGTILLGHLHWDHTHGLPFSGAVNHPEARVRIRDA